MESPAEPGSSLVGSIKRFVRTAVALVQNRLELLLVEAQEERTRVVGLLLLAGAALVLGLLTLVVLTFAIVAACGEEHRVAALGVMSGVYLLATLAVGWRLRQRLQRWVPFATTLAEFKKDKEWLDERS